jgi:hypothetical protein
MKIGILCTSCAALILSLQHSLEGKVLETTELSNKIALLETQLASTHDVCKGYTFSSLLPCLQSLGSAYTCLEGLGFSQVIDGYLQAPAIIHTKLQLLIVVVHCLRVEHSSKITQEESRRMQSIHGGPYSN